MPADSTHSSCDVLIVGGGVGGCAAALAACGLGLSVILTEETDWIGGQLTSQIVPPDEHPWIEQFGCTHRYRRYRNLVREIYQRRSHLTVSARSDPFLNPGGGWVSRICHEPRVGKRILQAMLRPFVVQGRLDLRLNTVLQGAMCISFPELDRGISTDSVSVRKDLVQEVALLDIRSGRRRVVRPKYVIDATETGELLPLCGSEFRLGAEAQSQTGEPHAVAGISEPDNVQGITWCMAIAHDPGSHRTIDRPSNYERWRSFSPQNWPGPLFGWDVISAHTGEVKQLPLFSDDWYALFPYRQIVRPDIFDPSFHPFPATVVNWPQNDYYARPLIPAPELGLECDPTLALRESRELTLCLLYWLQTEAPRHDGGVGYPGLFLRPDLTGTRDGLAKTPYIRESRRIEARKMVSELEVGAACNTGKTRSEPITDSVGVGAYRIDLHPAANGSRTIDVSSLPFQIPLGSLIPVRMRNLLPGAKNIGVTHIANGCFRLHPVEWNIGESVGALAAFCIYGHATPSDVYESESLTRDFQRLLESQHVELDWPQLRPL